MADLKNNYQIIGNGEKTIVFAHYFGGDSGSWKWLADHLKEKFTCVLIDLPGFNETKPLVNKNILAFAKYINSCINELDLTNYTLCGHSMSGKLVLYAAQLMKTNKPEQLILIAPSPPTTENMPKSEKKRMLKHPDRDEAVKTVQNAVVKKLSNERFEYAVSSQLRIENASWDWWINDGMNENIAESIKELDITVHVIYSKDDPVIKTDAIYEEVLPYLKHPKVTELSSVGHLIPMETPRILADQISIIMHVK